ncbi:MAG TPA: oxygenase MpaB family protein [Candidatus Saccharimonadia bacterium]|nr:oxygenase MpaB family protein [Candidatus Saccharimonadia bacterium]
MPNADPVLGFYGPRTAMWRVNREAVLLGAGPAALLLQIAHPHVAEGVAHHSDFEADPWRRLRRTLRTTLAMVFGDGPTAELAVRRLNGVHATIRGEATDAEARALAGTTYRAMDPELLLWVQVTLVWTSVQAYERWVEPLDGADREELWAEAREVGRRLGIPLDASPPDWAALEAYWDRMLAPDGPIAITPTARGLAASIIRPPIVGLPGVAIDLLATPGLALLPERIRVAYGVPWSPFRASLARVADVSLRLWVGLVPLGWRSMPQARAADRRARAAESADGASLQSAPPAPQEPTARA